MRPLIRKATAEDTARIGAIARAAYAKYVPRIGREPPPMVADFAAEVAAGHVVVIGTAGAVDGYMIAWPETDAYLVDNIAIDPARQGEGLGRQLMDHASPRPGALAWPRFGSKPTRPRRRICRFTPIWALSKAIARSRGDSTASICVGLFPAAKNECACPRRGQHRVKRGSSFREHFDADRFRIESLGASQLAAAGVAACRTQAIHLRAQIDVRDGIEQLLVLGEHRPDQIALLVELHVLADVQRRRDIERNDRIILQRRHDVLVAAPQRKIFATGNAGFRVELVPRRQMPAVPARRVRTFAAHAVLEIVVAFEGVFDDGHHRIVHFGEQLVARAQIDLARADLPFAVRIVGDGHEDIEARIDVEARPIHAVATNGRLQVRLAVWGALTRLAVARDVEVLAAKSAAAIVLSREVFLDLPHLPGTVAVEGVRGGEFPAQVHGAARMHA